VHRTQHRHRQGVERQHQRVAALRQQAVDRVGAALRRRVGVEGRQVGTDAEGPARTAQQQRAHLGVVAHAVQRLQRSLQQGHAQRIQVRGVAQRQRGHAIAHVQADRRVGSRLSSRVPLVAWAAAWFHMRLATSSSITSVAPPPMVRMRASRAMRSTGLPMM
jgi:hypothetical protein